MSKLRIGFVGAGFMGQNAHMFNYDALRDECEIVALAEPRPELARKVAARYGIPEVYGDHHELLKNAKVDAIVASQPYQRHAVLIPDILKARVPVFTEKPIALGVEAAEQLAKLGEELGVLHVVGYHKRSDPAVEYARSIMDEWNASGEFGQLRYIRVTMPPGNWIGGCDMPVSTDEPQPPSEFEPRPEGLDDEELHHYDFFVNYYIHQVNLIRHFLGEPYRFTFGVKSRVLMTGESESGTAVALEMATYFTSNDWHESVLIAYDKGFIKLELPPPLARQRPGKVVVMRDNGNGMPTFTEPILPYISAMRQQAGNFLAAVRGDRPAPCVASEAVEDLKIARDFIKFMSRNYQ